MALDLSLDVEGRGPASAPPEFDFGDGPFSDSFQHSTLEKLNQWAKQREITPLSNFFFNDEDLVEELEDRVEEEEIDEDEADRLQYVLGDWYDSVNALKSVQAHLALIEHHPAELSSFELGDVHEQLLHTLQVLMAILEPLAKEQMRVRINLSH